MAEDSAEAWHKTTHWKTARDLDTDFYAIRVEVNRPLDDEQARQLFGLIGYAFRQHLRGESLGEPERINDRTWAAHYDVTKSASDDWLYRLDDAISAAQQYAIVGTPPRKTARGGAVGSQLLPGLGPIDVRITFG